MSAINDGVLLKCHVQAIIKRYFKEKLYALDLMELWNEVINWKHPCQQFSPCFSFALLYEFHDNRNK
jgi:hypothetical protein